MTAIANNPGNYAHAQKLTQRRSQILPVDHARGQPEHIIHHGPEFFSEQSLGIKGLDDFDAAQTFFNQTQKTGVGSLNRQ